MRSALRDQQNYLSVCVAALTQLLCLASFGERQLGGDQDLNLPMPGQVRDFSKFILAPVVYDMKFAANAMCGSIVLEGRLDNTNGNAAPFQPPPRPRLRFTADRIETNIGRSQHILE